MERGGFQLAGGKMQHLPCPIALPIETPPFPLAESGPDSANGKGGVSIGRWQNTALTMSDSPTNRNPPFPLAESGPDSANGKGGVSIPPARQTDFAVFDIFMFFKLQKPEGIHLRK